MFYFYTPKTSESQTQTLNGYHVLPEQDFSWNCIDMKAILPFFDLILVFINAPIYKLSTEIEGARYCKVVIFGTLGIYSWKNSYKTMI